MSKCVVARFEKVSAEELSRTEVFRLSDVLLPKRATKGSAGYDFFATERLVLPPRTSLEVPTGIKCEIEEGYVLKLYPRSSLGFKYGICFDNSVGIIDSDYYNNPKNEGHIKVKLHNPSSTTVVIEKGQAYAQGILERFFYAEEEEVTSERVGGLGSTDV